MGGALPEDGRRDLVIPGWGGILPMAYESSDILRYFETLPDSQQGAPEGLSRRDDGSNDRCTSLADQEDGLGSFGGALLMFSLLHL